TGGGTPTPVHPVTMVGYDTFGSTTEASDANGNVTTTAFDPEGRPLSVTSPRYTPPGGTPITAVATRTYNPLGQVAMATDPLGHQTTYTYDQLGNLATTTAPNGGVTHDTYDTLGDRLSETDPNGALATRTYDYVGRPIRIAKLDGQGTVLSSRSATLDSNGNPLTTTDARGNTVRYTYDAMNRLSTEVQPVTPTSSITTSFGYDAAGNRTRFT